MRWLGPALAVMLATGCGGSGPKPSPSPAPGLAKDAPDAAHDLVLLRDVQAAVNEAVRAIPDCDAVKAGMEKAQRKLDEAAPRVRTEAGRVTLSAMRTQLHRSAEFCP